MIVGSVTPVNKWCSFGGDEEDLQHGGGCVLVINTITLVIIRCRCIKQLSMSVVYLGLGLETTLICRGIHLILSFFFFFFFSQSM